MSGMTDRDVLLAAEARIKDYIDIVYGDPKHCVATECTHAIAIAHRLRQMADAEPVAWIVDDNASIPRLITIFHAVALENVAQYGGTIRSLYVHDTAKDAAK